MDPKEHAWGVIEYSTTSGAILRVSMKVQGMIVASETAGKTLLKMECFTSQEMNIHLATKEIEDMFAQHNRLPQMVASQTGRLLKFLSRVLQTNLTSFRPICRP